MALLSEPCLIASPDGKQHVDLEPLCRGVIAEMSRRRGWQPERDDYDQALAHLFMEAVVIAARYDPQRGGPLRAYLYDRLRHRFDDYRRTWEGRRGQKRSTLDDWDALDVPADQDPDENGFPWHRLDRPSRALARMLVDDRPRSEIAAHFGLTETSLDRRLVQLRQQLVDLGLAPTDPPEPISLHNDRKEQAA